MSGKAVWSAAIIAVGITGGLARADDLNGSENVKQPGVGVDLTFGTDGFGVGMAWDDLLTIPNTVTRLSFTAGGISKSVNDTGTSYSGQLKMDNLAWLVDWAPNGGLFRLTGGLMFGSRKITLDAKATNGGVQYGNNSYPANQIVSINGEVKQDSRLAPYLGIGFGKLTGNDSGFFADAGVVLSSQLSSSMTATCSPYMVVTYCNQLQNDSLVEQTKLNNNVKLLKALPVLRIGYAIGF